MTDELDFLTGVADEDRSSLEYRLQSLVLEISGRAHGRIKQLGISQAELARRMDVSRPMVTKLLTGEANFQLRTLLRLGDALDMELMVDFVPEGFRLPVFYVNRSRWSMGAYSQSPAGASVDDKRNANSPKREIIPARGQHDTSKYTVPSLVKVA